MRVGEFLDEPKVAESEVIGPCEGSIGRKKLPLVIFVVEVSVAGEAVERGAECVVGTSIINLLLSKREIKLGSPGGRVRIASDLPDGVDEPLPREIQLRDSHIHPSNVRAGKSKQITKRSSISGLVSDANGDVLHEIAGGDGGQVEADVGGETPAVLQPVQKAVVGVAVGEVGKVVGGARF